jgi:hypothetical protein
MFAFGPGPDPTTRIRPPVSEQRKVRIDDDPGREHLGRIVRGTVGVSCLANQFLRRMVRTYQILFLGDANLSNNQRRFIYWGETGLNWRL